MPSWLIFNIDLMVNLVAILIAFNLRFNFQIPEPYFSNLIPIFFIVILIKGLTFFFGRTYAYIIRYTSIRDLLKVSLVLAISTIILLGVNSVISNYTQTVFIPVSVLIIDFIVSSYLMISMRMVIKRLFISFTQYTQQRANTLIFGSSELAVSIKRALEVNPDSDYNIVAFVDNLKDTYKKRVEGLDIYNIKKIEQLIKDFNIKKLILAKDHISPILKNSVVEKCLNKDVSVLSISNLNHWIQGESTQLKINNIKIEDLLERDPIVLDTTQIRKQLTNKTVLVTGAAGSIGSELVRQVENYNPFKIILLDQAETPLHNIELEITAKPYHCKTEIIIGDIANQKKMESLFLSHKIDVVFHAAAYKHVPMMEHHPSEAILNNVLGTKILSDCAVQFGVEKFIMISTDKAVNPTNVMGASKRIAEIYTQSMNDLGVTSFITTRFGNVLGSNGSVIPLFKRQIEMGGPVTVTDPEVTRYFMTIPEACQLVLEAGAMGKGGEIFIFDMGNSVKIVDLAKNMIKMSGLTPGKDIEIKYVGLRPGEKLYEELLAQEENTIPTHHPKIMVGKVRKYNLSEVNSQVSDLIAAVHNQDNFEIVSQMKKMVPEFISHNSIFKALDSKPFKSSVYYSK